MKLSVIFDTKHGPATIPIVVQCFQIRKELHVPESIKAFVVEIKNVVDLESFIINICVLSEKLL